MHGGRRSSRGWFSYRAVGAVLVVLLMGALPAQAAQLRTSPPILDIYASGSGGGAASSSGEGRPAWVTTERVGSLVADVDDGSDVTWGVDDLLVRSWRTDPSENRRLVIEDNVARFDLDGTVSTDVRALRDANNHVTNPLNNRVLAALDVTPGFGWFLPVHRMPHEVADDSDWLTNPLDGEKATMTVDWVCYGWDLSETIGSAPFDLFQHRSWGEFIGPIRLEWHVDPTNYDSTGSAVDPRQRNDRLKVMAQVHDPYHQLERCTASTRFEVDLLVVHEMYEPLLRTICQYTMGYFSTGRYHYTSEVKVAFSRDVGTSGKDTWVGESQNVSILYFPVLTHQHVIQTVSAQDDHAIEDVSDEVNAAGWGVYRQAAPSNDVLYVEGVEEALGTAIKGVYHQTGGPGKSECYKLLKT